jgi:small subunit ribosomal protein S15
MEKIDSKEKPLWMKYSKEEVESLIVKLAKQGNSPSKIGLILKDSYGIPSSRLVTERITKILKKNKLYEKPKDLMDLVVKVNKLKKHFNSNKQDKVAKRGILITESKINKLARYYKKKGIIPVKWKYTQEKI